ncbi:hypothetical protein NQ317_017087 [Molorchus minor]|uniref:Uncharacterized protein n=1 Tax=Molorchus minor TaxID=1323400 RepID=A0ABQ9K517_9CUCU|nr:hypothetical protein NQ317_017087 [Molorchus minor]
MLRIATVDDDSGEFSGQRTVEKAGSTIKLQESSKPKIPGKTTNGFIPLCQLPVLHYNRNTYDLGKPFQSSTGVGSTWGDQITSAVSMQLLGCPRQQKSWMDHLGGECTAAGVLHPTKPSRI